MFWRSALLCCLFASPATAQTTCPSVVLRVVTDSIEVFQDREFQRSVGRVDKDQLPEGTPITACFAGIAYRIELGGNVYWVRRLGIRTRTGNPVVPRMSDKVIPYGAGGRGMFE